MKNIVTNSFSETQKIGEILAGDIENLQVVALHGDLGAGKTTFVQGFAKALGVERNIQSPTFIIMRTYEIKFKNQNSKIKNINKKYLYHVDLYRAENVKDVEGLGLLELMQDPENIILIEWPEKIEKYLPKKTKHMYFTYVDDEKREIKEGSK